MVSGPYHDTDRITVEAVPAQLTLTEVTPEYIAIKNESGVEVDIGRWLLFEGGQQFMFPEHTIILDGHEVLISNKRTGLSGTEPETAALQYPNGVVATTYQHPLFVSSSAQEEAAVTAVSQVPEVDSAEQATAQPTQENPLHQTAAAANNSELIPNWWWFAGLAGLVLLAMVGYFLPGVIQRILSITWLK